MSKWIKFNEQISNDELVKLKEKFLKNKIKVAYIDSDRIYLRLKPLDNLKIYNSNSDNLKEFIDFFINIDINKTVTASEEELLLYLNNKNVVILKNKGKNKAIYYNCSHSLQQLRLNE